MKYIDSSIADMIDSDKTASKLTKMQFFPSCHRPQNQLV